MNKFTIAMYDLEDNLITVFESYRECAKYFKTSVKSIHCYICRSQKGKIDKKYNKEDHKWYRLVKWLEIEDDYE